MIKLQAVLTTIQEPTESVRALAAALSTYAAGLIVIGDRKGPSRFEIPSADFFPLERQHGLPFKLARMLPEGHYSRKNLGYLIAFERGAQCVYETDDDNAPLPRWEPRNETISAQRTHARRWLNVYRLFSDELIWPRGFPLDRIRDPKTCEHDADSSLENITAPIQQGLANGAPDLDAVWRLVFERPVDFKVAPSVWLPPGTYCPFNSQTTWWWPEAFPLMYLPSFCSFRMCDIWRSLVAQRCLWEMGRGLLFHAAEVFQQRNTHNLLHDFKDETPGYLNNDRIITVLNECTLSPGPENTRPNLRRCYLALVQASIIPSEEVPLIDAWLDDFDGVSTRINSRPSS